MSNHTIIVTEAQMELLHELIASDMQQSRHWACNHLSRGSVADATALAHRIDTLRPLFAATNIAACRTIAESTGRALKLEHIAA